jgi:hypothetical protein
MVAAYSLATHSSVEAVTASLMKQFLMRELLKFTQEVASLMQVETLENIRYLSRDSLESRNNCRIYIRGNDTVVTKLNPLNIAIKQHCCNNEVVKGKKIHAYFTLMSAASSGISLTISSRASYRHMRSYYKMNLLTNSYS